MTSDIHLQAFIARQRELLLKERNAEIERTSLLLTKCGPKLLEQKGLAIGSLGVVNMNVGLGGKTLVELERPTAYNTSPLFPPHTFRPGDLARIEPHVSTSGPMKKAKSAGKATSVSDEKTSQQVEGVVYRVSDTRIIVAVDADNGTEDLDLAERCRVVKLANSVTYDRMDKTIDTLERLLRPSSTDKPAGEISQMGRVLLGLSLPSPISPPPDLQFFDPGLNESQKEAVRFALGSPEVACIHGPPGTGKTHTIIEIIRHLIFPPTGSQEKPKRVLVCGASNLAVDNILERLLLLPPGPRGEKAKVTRIGHPARVMSREDILDSTLEVQSTRSDEAALAKDAKDELENILGALSGKGKGSKGKRPRGSERKKMWEEVKALRREYRQREGAVVRSVLKEAQVVVATCHSSGGRQLFNERFDVVIIDEATQALEAVCWIPILKANKLILAGDPMQLPPTILSLDAERKKKEKEKAKAQQAKGNPTKGDPKKTNNEKKRTGAKTTSVKATPAPAPPPDSESTDDGDDDTEGEDVPTLTTTPAAGVKRTPVLEPPRTLEVTLFDRLEKMYGPGIKRMLAVQYRMHKSICEFPSRALYQSKLESHSSVASHLLRDLPGLSSSNLSEEDIKEVLGTPVVFFDTAGCEYFERVEDDTDDGSRCNENEAMVVKGWIERLVESGLLPSQIAVITPYQAQVTLLSSLLRPLYGPEIEIGTVDGMQGREKEAIVISMVRSNDTREVGFLKEKRRMNVAMTRARRHLCVVGDSSTVRHGGKYLKSWLAWLESNADIRYGGLE